MAYEMKIRGTEHEVKVRNPWAVALLPIVTLGIYHLVWWYKINKELKAYGEAKGYDLGQNPTNSVLAISLGALIIVPAIVTMWRTSGRIESSQETVGIDQRASGPVIFILILLIWPVGLWYAQHELNKVWEAQPESGGATLAAPEQPVAAPEQPVAAEEPAAPAPGEEPR
jgi:hypothetical protein